MRPRCTHCGTTFSPLCGIVLDADANTGICDVCGKPGLGGYQAITDPFAILALEERFARNQRKLIEIGKAGRKNEKRSTIREQLNMRPKYVQRINAARQKRLQKTYRNRASYAAAHDVRNH